jgi:hypothetical protein
LSSARKIHVGVVGSGRTKRMHNPLKGLPRLERTVVISEPFSSGCPCGDFCDIRSDRDGLTWVECRSCGASNHASRRAAID